MDVLFYTKPFLRSRRTLAIISMYLFKDYARTAGRLKPTTNEIFMRMFVFKFFCTSNY